jgi:formiminoglutamate deiminase
MIHARRAFLPQGWVADVRICLDAGRIAQVHTGVQAEPGDTRVGLLLPALSNLHSHSFQRAMAGLTEHRQAGQGDSFWTWRDMMYRFLAHLAPDDVEAVAAQVFVEMMEAGYAAVAEFHYLHHQPDGTPYADRAEMTARIAAAAQAMGIGLTHLPVLYSYGGAGRAPLAGGQLRFGNDLNGFADLLDAVRSALAGLPPDTRLGIAPHSLRATSPGDLAAALPLARGGSIHLHIAEQPKEVADITAWLGARPVEWLLDHAPVGPDWCAIHATHLTADETRALAATGAVAGLCPITEANLGDGPFNGTGWIAGGGTFGVGSDSNVRIALAEELRTLEYSQRLRDLARNVLVQGEGSVGQFLYARAASGGAQALGRAAGAIAPGLWADLVALDDAHPAIAALPDDRLLDGIVFAAPDTLVTDVWSAGRHSVRDGRHIARDPVRMRFAATMARLMDRL